MNFPIGPLQPSNPDSDLDIRLLEVNPIVITIGIKTQLHFSTQAYFNISRGLLGVSVCENSTHLTTDIVEKQINDSLSIKI